jgi:O-antigen ligase
MTRPAAPLPLRPVAVQWSRVASLLTAVAFGGLLVLTLSSPGATRMHATPWSSLYLVTLLLPVLALLVRAGDPAAPLVLPGAGGTGVVGVTGVAIVLSASLSPHRGPAWLGAAPLLAALGVFLLACDWLHRDVSATARRRETLRQLLLATFAVIALTSLALWFGQVSGYDGATMLGFRNHFPLGHPNYTAGIALLVLPTAVLLVQRRRGRWQMAAAGTLVLALLLLFTSGSRGGLIGLGVIAIAAWLMSPLSRRQKWQFALVGGAAAIVFAFAHPRTRAMFQPEPAGAAPNLSNVQRAAMLVAGGRMGLDRPAFGWGPGTTPLVYPRYRAELDGGVENVLQLHSLPVQLWAELGSAGVAAYLVAAFLLVRGAPGDRTAAVTLAGYLAFAVTDWQLDVPIFGATCAVLAAQLASAPAGPATLTARRWTLVLTVTALVFTALWARRDPTPVMNSTALSSARNGETARAVALFEESLRLNPDQEIAHFNLGWLRVVSDPAKAEQDFLAALHLVPDKGAAYFGLGLARLNQGRPAAAVHAFAMECLNDPAFMASAWWREPVLGARRPEVSAEFSRLLAAVRAGLPAGSWATAQLDLLANVASRIGEVPAGPERSFRRERTGYPVLMRNLDLPTPVDLFDVRGTAPIPDWLPPKGWLPSPLLLSLLDSPAAKLSRP